MQIIYDEEFKSDERLQALFMKAAETALAREGIDAELCELSLSFVTQDEIKALNALYRGKDKPTDVLSFPMIEFRCGGDSSGSGCIGGIDVNPETGRIILGDIVISLERMEVQAREYKHSFERELAFLAVHGMLHLCGYDHKGGDDERIMFDLQKKILREIGF